MSKRYVLALITTEQSDALDVCPYAACAHLGSDHGAIATGCAVDECTCGESDPLDARARAAVAENFTGISMTDDERINRGFDAADKENDSDSE